MKRTNWLVILSILSLSLCMAAHGAQTTDSSIATYPLQVGNLWQYYTYDYFNGQYTWTYGWTTKIVSDTLMPDGNTYAIAQSDYRLGTANALMKQIGPKVVLYSADSNSQFVLYDFSKSPFDTLYAKPIKNSPDSEIYIVRSISNFNVLGNIRKTWQFYTFYSKSTIFNSDYVADGFGLITVKGEAGDEWFLRGAVINGVQYGTITAVKDHNMPINPAGFEIYPNYPNPFNGSTNISFSLSHDQNISIKIYDMLGREVGCLFNGKMSPGYHKVTWNGKNDRGIDLPSGIYLCRVLNEGVSKQMNMLMIK